LPLVVAILLAVPVGVTWLLARRASKRKEQAASEAAQDPAAAEAQATDADQEIKWDQRYETVGDIVHYFLLTSTGKARMIAIARICNLGILALHFLLNCAYSAK